MVKQNINKISICLFSVMVGVSAMVAAYTDDVIICNKPGTSTCISNMQDTSRLFGSIF
jgi:hypothetical protein